MALNRALQGILKEFKEKYLFEDTDSKIFEHLVNYLTVTKYHPEAFNDKEDFERLIVDKESQFGIDGIAFIVNGNLVYTKEDIKDYAKSKYLDIQILITQAKTTEKCETGDLLKTIAATKSFFGDRKLITEKNNEIENAIEIYDELFNYASYFTSNSPQCIINYVTAATTANLQLVLDICNSAEKEILNDCPDIKTSKISVNGSDYIQDTYKEIKNSVEVQINFKNNLSFDKIKDVEQSYLGYVTGEEFLKIIIDKNGDLRTRIFYENVRDYQGEKNIVNKEIRETIYSDTFKDKFVLLNNGVTIVTKHYKALGSNLVEMRDFQIVNGCQTSHEIYNARDVVSDILVPVKIIHTLNTDVITSIVKSTNRQTPVPNEAFVALESYHKHLQDTFEAYSKNMPIPTFYERRTGEYSLRRNSEKKYEVATLHAIIRCVTSVYFQEAYVVYNNNPANILKNRYSKLFQESQPYDIYFISYYLFANFLIESKNHTFNHLNYKFRFYIIMVTRCLLLDSVDVAEFSSKDMKKEINKLIEIFEKYPSILQQKIGLAAEIVNEAIENTVEEHKKKGQGKNYDYISRSRKFNDKVLDITREKLLEVNL